LTKRKSESCKTGIEDFLRHSWPG